MWSFLQSCESHSLFSVAVAALRTAGGRALDELRGCGTGGKAPCTAAGVAPATHWLVLCGSQALLLAWEV